MSESTQFNHSKARTSLGLGLLLLIFCALNACSEAANDAGEQDSPTTTGPGASSNTPDPGAGASTPDNTSQSIVRHNDTGITLCADESANDLSCPAGNYPGQDGETGRDVSANNAYDGRAGFQFTKMDAAGNALANQSQTYTQQPWACVYDDLTGMHWEVKTDDGGDRDSAWKYSWYSGDALNNGGDPGNLGDINSNASCAGLSLCNTEAYVNKVNAVRLCGFDDWRLPTPHELKNIRDYGKRRPLGSSTDLHAIDLDYFPNTQDYFYWTRASDVDDQGVARKIGFFIRDDGGNSYVDNAALKDGRYYLRLVRGGDYADVAPFKGRADCSTAIRPTTPNERFILHADGTATDKLTNLMWSRCSAGQGYDAGTGECTDIAKDYTDWAQALDAAASAEYAGYSDWRLPNIKELAAIVEFACGWDNAPMVNTTVFPGVYAYAYWSSSPNVDPTQIGRVWYMDFILGEENYLGNMTNDLMAVVLVRDTQGVP